MTIIVTSLGTTNNVSGSTLALSSATFPSGALIFVFAAEGGVTITSDGTCGDPTNGATAYTKLNAVPTPCANYGISFYFKNSAGFTGAITYNKFATKDCAMWGLYAQGIDTVSPLDTGFTATATNTSNTPSVTSTAAPVIPGSLIIGAVNAGSGASHNLTQDGGHGWTDPSPTVINNTNKTCEVIGAYQTGSAQTTYSPGLAASEFWFACIYAFAPISVPTVPDQVWDKVAPLKLKKDEWTAISAPAGVTSFIAKPFEQPPKLLAKKDSWRDEFPRIPPVVFQPIPRWTFDSDKFMPKRESWHVILPPMPQVVTAFPHLPGPFFETVKLLATPINVWAAPARLSVAPPVIDQPFERVRLLVAPINVWGAPIQLNATPPVLGQQFERAKPLVQLRANWDIAPPALAAIANTTAFLPGPFFTLQGRLPQPQEFWSMSGRVFAQVLPGSKVTGAYPKWRFLG